jgi:hypothetical protein
MGIRRDVNTDRSPEGSNRGTVEGHVTRGLEQGAAHGAVGLICGDDGLAEKKIARVQQDWTRSQSKNVKCFRVCVGQCLSRYLFI